MIHYYFSESTTIQDHENNNELIRGLCERKLIFFSFAHLQKYFFCNVGATTNSNKYTYGNHMEYLLQPANISSFSNENLVNS